MNILYVAHENRMGGAGLSLLGMIDEMVKDNRVYVVVPVKYGFLTEELKKRGITCCYLHSFWWMLAPEKTKARTLVKKMMYRLLYLNNYICALRLCRYVKEKQIDIIHSNSGVISTGAILAKMTGVPHVWHLREFGQEDFLFFPVWNYEKMCRFIRDNSKKVIAISQAVYQKFLPYIGKEKLAVVYNGVDVSNSQCKTALKRRGDTIHFLLSGRVSAEKGQEEAVRAVGLLVQRGWENLHLSIAGAGACEELKNKIMEYKLESKVSVLGVVADMPALRKDMDIEIVCSRCEAFGRVTVEAMMSSNPVIGTNSGGTPELIREGETGYLYQPGNVEELADKMEIFLREPDKIRLMGNEAFGQSRERYTQKRNGEEIKEIYREIWQ